jgi:hypothetical protein
VDYIHRKGGVTVNKNLLISKMKLFGDRQEDLANALGLSLSRTNAKINETDGAEFNKSEITIMKVRYHLTPEEVDSIFFAEKVS